jgi:hypothetical protein
MIVSESLDQFLNEDLGTLKPFEDIPKEWKEKLLHTGSYKGQGGEHSIVKELPSNADYKTFLKFLKDETLILSIIKKDGQSTFMIEKISANKFKVRRAEGESSIKQKKREAEQKAKEAERQKSNENLNPPKVDEINERWGHGRRGGGTYYDSADVGEMSVPELQKWLERQKTENPNSTYQIFLIFADPERGKKRQERMDIRNVEDPFITTPGSTTREASPVQSQRYDIFAEKKRAKLDKEMDKVLDDFKQQLIDNFDKSMEKTLYDIRRGYSWNLDAKTIGENLMKGVNMTELKKFTEAYDAIEPDNYKKDAAKAAEKLKKLGF